MSVAPSARRGPCCSESNREVSAAREALPDQENPRRVADEGWSFVFLSELFSRAETGLAGLPGRSDARRHCRAARLRFDLGRRASFLALHDDSRRAAVHDLYGRTHQKDRLRLDGGGAAVA